MSRRTGTPPPSGTQPSARGPAIDPWLWSGTYWETWLAGMDPAGAGRRLRDSRLASLLRAARASPLYGQRLGDVDGAAPPDLGAVEPVGKDELMGRFDEWATDRGVTHAAVARLLRHGCPGDALLGRYVVWTSSGTSGTPGIFVQDARSLAAYDALDAWRLRGAPAQGVPLPVWAAGRRLAFVGASGGHFAGVVSVERLRRQRAEPAMAPMRWWAPALDTFPVQASLDVLARDLQAFEPDVLITYPSCAAALAHLQQQGRLHLRLLEVWCGGEQLSPAQRAAVRHAFQVPLRNNYGASEFFSMAWECEHERLHLNDDWVVLEPIDRAGRPVPPGAAAHAVLLTNLANHVQPLIRYRLEDAVRFTGERCPCGCALPVIEVQGRAADTLLLKDDGGGDVTLLPLALETVIEEEGGLTQFQLLRTAPDRLELRLEPEVPEPDAAFARARDALLRYLKGLHLGTIHVVHGRAEPVRDARSGKLRRVRDLAGDRP